MRDLRLESLAWQGILTVATIFTPLTMIVQSVLVEERNRKYHT
jgi:hypothetical protein